MPLQVSRIHAICFDVDGTLSDTDDVMVATHRTSETISLAFARKGPHPGGARHRNGGRSSG